LFISWGVRSLTCISPFFLQPTTITRHATQHDETCSKGTIGAFADHSSTISLLEGKQTEVDVVLRPVFPSTGLSPLDKEGTA
jgi:hypothetical protein